MNRDNQNENHRYDGYARVRHVPIFVESRGDSVSPNENLNNQEGETYETNRIHGNLNQLNQRFPESAPPSHRNTHQHVNSDQHYNNLNQDYNRSRPGVQPVDVSSIDISYRPNQQHARNHFNSREGQTNDFYVDRQNFNNPEASANKENSNKNSNQLRTANKSPDSRRAKEQQQEQEKQREEENKGGTEDRPKTPAVIPLPPPPEQEAANEQAVAHERKSPPSKESLNDKQTPKQQQQQQHYEKHQDQLGQKEQSVEFKKPKKESGPLGIIMATKQEVNKLLHEVINCNETSLKSKEYLRLDELLTRCILKLDDIECGDSQDLRQQRKAVIELIDKCTDILQRKVQLNHDIKSLALKSASSD